MRVFIHSWHLIRLVVWLTSCSVPLFFLSCGGARVEPLGTPSVSSPASAPTSLLSSVLSLADLPTGWTAAPAPPFGAGIGPCEPQRPAVYSAESHVGYAKDSTTLLEAVASFASTAAAASVVHGERASVSSCKPGTGYAFLNVSFGDESVAYTQRIGMQQAAIAVIRAGARVIAVDYVDATGPVDLGAVNQIVQLALRKVSGP